MSPSNFCPHLPCLLTLPRRSTFYNVINVIYMLITVVLIGLRRQAVRKGARKAELGGDALDAVVGVEVLDENHLVASCGTLAGDDGGVGEEEFPDLVITTC